MIFKFIKSYYKHKRSLTLITFGHVTKSRAEFENDLIPEVELFMEEMEKIRLYIVNLRTYKNALLSIAKHDLKIMYDPDDVASKHTLSMWYYITTRVAEIRRTVSHNSDYESYEKLSEIDKVWYKRKVLDCLSDYYIDGHVLDHSDIVENAAIDLKYGLLEETK